MAEMDEVIECSICLLTYDEHNHKPKFLSCHHTLCYSCCLNYEGQPKIPCPICRQETPSSGSVDNLQTNFYILKMLELSPKRTDDETELTPESNAGKRQGSKTSAQNHKRAQRPPEAGAVPRRRNDRPHSETHMENEAVFQRLAFRHRVQGQGPEHTHNGAIPRRIAHDQRFAMNHRRHTEAEAVPQHLIERLEHGIGHMRIVAPSLVCGNCSHPYDQGNWKAKRLAECGHTLCFMCCITSEHDNRILVCPMCDEVTLSTADDLPDEKENQEVHVDNSSLLQSIIHDLEQQLPSPQFRSCIEQLLEIHWSIRDNPASEFYKAVTKDEGFSQAVWRHRLCRRFLQEAKWRDSSEHIRYEGGIAQVMTVITVLANSKARRDNADFNYGGHKREVSMTEQQMYDQFLASNAREKGNHTRHASGRGNEPRNASGRENEPRNASRRENEPRNASGRVNELRNASGRGNELRNASGRGNETGPAIGRANETGNANGGGNKTGKSSRKRKKRQNGHSSFRHDQDY